MIRIEERRFVNIITGHTALSNIADLCEQNAFAGPCVNPRNGHIFMTGWGGMYKGLRAPERSNCASRTASRRSVCTRSLAFWGMHDGATTQQVSCSWTRYRYCQYPHGPAV